MKKLSILLLFVSGTFLFAQRNLSSDEPSSPKPENAQVVLKLPSEVSLTSNEYHDQLHSLNKLGATLKVQTDPGSSDVVSQQFESTNSVKTTNVADDFNVPAGKRWFIESVSAVGTFIGPVQPTVFNVTFYSNSATNLPENVLRTETIILSAASINPTLPLASPLLLQSGTYWVSVQAVSNSSTQGTWLWKSYNAFDTFGFPFALKNAGNGYGFPCFINWAYYSTCSGQKFKDLQFTLTGTESLIPCKTFTGRLTTADPTQTSRVARILPASVCGTAKPFPGILNPGTLFHYKTYNVKNQSATSQCYTFNLFNGDTNSANQVFLIAYNGTFNPADISQNYLGDTASSTANAAGFPSVSMEITVPAGATVVLVAAEGSTGVVYPFTADYTIDVTSSDCSTILKTTEISQNSTTLYPNPTSGKLQVSGILLKQAKVYDASGKAVPVKTMGNNINVENLPKGTYLIQLEDKSGKTTSDKFIKN